MGATEGPWRAYSPVCPEDPAVLGALVSHAGGCSSVLNLPFSKNQVNENCEHRSGI